MDSLISIIVPVYNSEKYLCNCLNSILNQTYKNFEVIIVCDKSSDNSFTICENYSKQNSNIKVIFRDNASGVSFARNVALNNISQNSKYICFVDSDDYIDKNYLQILKNNLEENNADVSVCSYKQTKSMTLKSKNKTQKIEKLDKISACKKIFLMQHLSGFCWNKLYKTSIVGDLRFDENARFGEDTLFVFNYLIRCNLIVYTNKILYFYYNNQQSAVNTKFNNKRMSILDSLKNIQNTAKNISQTIKTYASAWYFLMALEILVYLKLEKKKQKDKILYVKNILRNNYTFYKAVKKDFVGLSKFGGIGANLLVEKLNKK